MSAEFLSGVFSLDGKCAIITGGTGGLGLEMTTTLAKAGADIVSIQLPNDPLAEGLVGAVASAGRKLQVFECNVADSKQLRGCFAKMWESGITPDILLNCAGIMRRKPILDMTDDDLDAILAVNLRGSYVAAQEFGRQLIKLNRPGKVINLGSIYSFMGANNTSMYTASKGAVLQMTKAFSNEWASKGIQVNAICPGFTKTAMTAESRKDQAYEKNIISRIPASRWGTPDDFQGVVIFLASKASDFITGTGIVVDGGLLGGPSISSVS